MRRPLGLCASGWGWAWDYVERGLEAFWGDCSQVVLTQVCTLLELSLILANSATSEMTNVILFASRIAARVESHAHFLIKYAEMSPEDTGAAYALHGIELTETELLVLKEVCRGPCRRGPAACCLFACAHASQASATSDMTGLFLS